MNFLEGRYFGTFGKISFQTTSEWKAHFRNGRIQGLVGLDSRLGPCWPGIYIGKKKRL